MKNYVFQLPDAYKLRVDSRGFEKSIEQLPEWTGQNI